MERWLPPPQILSAWVTPWAGSRKGGAPDHSSEAGAEKPADRKPPAHLGNQITRITEGILGEGKCTSVHSNGSQEHAYPARVRASFFCRGACHPCERHRLDTQQPLRRPWTGGRRTNREGGCSVGSRDEKDSSHKCLSES